MKSKERQLKSLKQKGRTLMQEFEDDFEEWAVEDHTGHKYDV